MYGYSSEVSAARQLARERAAFRADGDEVTEEDVEAAMPRAERAPAPLTEEGRSAVTERRQGQGVKPT
jgi:hypothetical protein